ncbi:hypothetical protein QQS21_000778 [Conoideocrella luteorostrata]|uniref:Uncharacterized protein n=1 Tax=Conoideocrella luteorostrata TaxID=1105319 RepID=A0AAJ0CYD3_9HYPO|nr:hypothetical protein QQS21_000778 [Conoideocrella luteorostrata]
MVQQSAGLANLESLLLPSDFNGTFGATRVPPARRPTMAFRNLKNGTKSSELTVPFFNITSFAWVTSDDELPQDLKAATLNQTGPLGGFSRDENPLQITVEGVAAPLRTALWNGSALAKRGFPKRLCCATPGMRRFRRNEAQKRPGDEVPVILHTDAWNDITSCFAVARMDIVAGTVACVSSDSNGSSCSLRRSPLAVEYRSDLPYIPKPDQLVEQVFAMLPEVMALMVITGGFTSIYDTDKRTMPPVDTEMFLRNALTLGYQGTWSSFAERLANSVISVNHREPVPVVTSLVNQSRMDIWLGLQLLMTISGMTLYVLHSKSRWPTLVEPVLSLLLLDCTGVVSSKRKWKDQRLVLGTKDDYADGYGDVYGVLKPKPKAQDAESNLV